MTGLALRLVAAAAAGLLLVSSSLALSRGRGPADVPTAAPAGPPLVGPSDPTPSGRPSPTPALDPLAILGDPGVAAQAGAAAVLAAGLEVARGRWGHMLGPWEAVERPVYVGRAELAAQRLTADLVIAFRADDRGALPLRLLPAAATGRVDLTITRDGRRLSSELDAAGARVVVDLGEVEPREPVLLRLHVGYDVPELADLPDDGSPASFGLLAGQDGLTVLGHWLPLIALPGEDGAMVPWGDVAGFPPAVWSVRLTHPGRSVSSGRESACPDRPRGCTWHQGVALRDLAVVVGDDLTTQALDVGGLRVRAAAPAGTDAAGGTAVVLQEAAAAVATHLGRFGPLAWPDLEVVAAPLRDGAAGMEFPGLVLVDTDAWGAMGGGFGTYVVSHEVAHQWFHALVGSGSLSAPVVDESLAQYGAYLTYADRFGESAAETLSRGFFSGRYEDALAAGVDDAPPGQPLEDFAGDAAYGPLVYGRGALAWVVAERELGRAAVVGFVAELVDSRGLREIGVSELIARAEATVPPLGEILRRYWLEASPR